MENDRVSVRRPARETAHRAIVVGHLPRMRTVAVGNPDLAVSGTKRTKGYLPPIRGKLRVVVDQTGTGPAIDRLYFEDVVELGRPDICSKRLPRVNHPGSIA